MKKERSEVDTRPEPIDIEHMELKTLADFEVYNKWARSNRRKVKVPTEQYYKKYKVKFQRFDQPENVLKARVRNKDIDWSGQLIPGGIYELPMPVIRFLNNLAVPKYAEVKSKDGDGVTETVKVGEIQRFSCQIMDIAE